jgi:hypothetical protein
MNIGGFWRKGEVGNPRAWGEQRQVGGVGRSSSLGQGPEREAVNARR